MCQLPSAKTKMKPFHTGSACCCRLQSSALRADQRPSQKASRLGPIPPGDARLELKLQDNNLCPGLLPLHHPVLGHPARRLNRRCSGQDAPAHPGHRLTRHSRHLNSGGACYLVPETSTSTRRSGCRQAINAMLGLLPLQSPAFVTGSDPSTPVAVILLPGMPADSDK